MKFSPKQYAQALMGALESASPQDQELVLDNFVKVLVENNDQRLCEEIYDEICKCELQNKGIQQIEVISARPINPENERQILNKLNQIVSGKFELKKKVDESLIGGVVIRMEDQVLDASVKNNLEQLKKELSE